MDTTVINISLQGVYNAVGASLALIALFWAISKVVQTFKK
jgi:hypothetical protein